MIRSFFAINLPETWCRELSRLQDRLKKTRADVKWVRPESVHLTLKFLGNVPEQTLDELCRAAGPALAQHPALALHLEGAGVFPTRNRPRVVWLGLGGQLERLNRLQKDLEAVAAQYGFEPEERPFRPHLTLGRVRSGQGRLDLLNELEKIQPNTFEFTAREVVLFRSDLKPTGAIYTALKKLPLAGTFMEEVT